MTHVQFLACDGCGEKIDEDSSYIDLELTAKDKRGDNEELTSFTDFLRRTHPMFGSDGRKSTHRHYHFHSEECVARFMHNYSKGVGDAKSKTS